MSFINRVAASNNSVTFRIAPVIDGDVYKTPLDKVTFMYKADNGTWKTGTMTTSDEINFVANISNLYTSKIEYYVKAKNDAWKFGTWLDAYRPYRHSDTALLIDHL